MTTAEQRLARLEAIEEIRALGVWVARKLPERISKVLLRKLW